MAGQEARINDALKQLGEEFRLGMVQVAEHRSRRKLLVDSWGERDVTTSPRKSRAGAGPVTTQGPRAAPPPTPKQKSPIPFIIAGAALLALVAGAWYFLGSKPAASNVPAMAPISPPALAMRKAADDFITRNAWDADSIGAFVNQWRSLDAADRARIADEPEIRTLRYKLDQNIQAELQLVTPDSTPEQRARLTMLQDFSAALSGTPHE